MSQSISQSGLGSHLTSMWDMSSFWVVRKQMHIMRKKWRWDLRTQRALSKCWDLYNNLSSVLLWTESKPKSKAFDFAQLNKVQVVGMVLRMEISTIAWSHGKGEFLGCSQEADCPACGHLCLKKQLLWRLRQTALKSKLYAILGNTSEFNKTVAVI